MAVVRDVSYLSMRADSNANWGTTKAAKKIIDAIYPAEVEGAARAAGAAA